ncbi:MAG: hypothetical protein WCI73_13965, partial [Phycisphaerae bacterium]
DPTNRFPATTPQKPQHPQPRADGQERNGVERDVVEANLNGQKRRLQYGKWLPQKKFFANFRAGFPGRFSEKVWIIKRACKAQL